MTDDSPTNAADHPNPLGRIHIPDERDADYPISAALPDAEVRGWRYWWADGWWGDQFYTPQCVAYAWAHLLEDGPVTQAPFAAQRTAQHDAGALLDVSDLYDEAQRNDHWPGEDYDGTSVRAGAKVLQSRGMIGTYRWASTVAEVAQAIILVGPVVAGTTWTSDMFTPDDDGFVRPTGDPAGGHAYVLNGVNVDERRFRFKNSWGRDWGLDGYGWFTFDDFAALMADNGEVCLPTEIQI